MKRLLSWFDDHILTIFSFVLIALIPLYPKLPMLELIPGYIVRVRLEDFFILFAFFIFLIQVARKKATYKSILFWPIVIYLSVGFLSCLSAIFITKTVPVDKIHIIKVFAHWARRVEYFSIFFIFYNGITSQKIAKKFLIFALLVLCLVSFYGFGQKYLYWPVYSTMNREFSKGMKLYLTEHARVSSTFGGHYDLAAFLVIFLSLFVAFFLSLKKGFLKWLFLVGFLLSYWTLILSASRTSFIAYLGGVTILLIVFSFIKGFLWSSTRWFAIIFFSLFIMFTFGDLSDRFAHLFKINDLKAKLRLDRFTSPFKAPPTNSIALTGDLQLVLDKTDERPVVKKPKKLKDLPPDVYERIPDYVKIEEDEASKSATFSATHEATTPIERTFSENAYKYGLSAAIRLDALWPWAIQGFKRNPFLGSGYSTLNKTTVSQFTEAESTDNEYLRALGETGALGFLTFFGIIFIILKTSVNAIRKNRKKFNSFISIFAAGFIALTSGLLINAIYIDVFEASKVAFTYWALTGVFLASLKSSSVKKA